MQRGDPEPHALGAPSSRWVRAIVVLLVAVVVPATLVALTMVRFPEFSALDEPAHSDYLRRIEQGEVPRVGDKMLEQTVEDVQCRTVAGNRNAPCGLDEYSTDLLAADGYQYEAQQPPLYYVITALLRQPARIGPADDFVTTARLTGVVWLATGLLVFFAACRRLGCSFWSTAAVTLLLGMAPGVIYQSATINNDAAAILTGSVALLMFAQLRARVSTARVVGWCAVAVALVLLKPTGVIAVAAVCAALVLDAAVDRRLTRRLFLALAAPLAAGLATYLVWGVIRDHRGTVDYDVVLVALLSFKMVDELPLEDIASSYGRFLGAYAPGGLPTTPSWVASPASVVMMLFTAAGVSVLWAKRLGEAAQRVAGVALVASLAGGPAFTALFYFDYSVGGGPTARYGISLLPLLFAGGAALYRTRRALVALLGVAVILLVPLLLAVT